jgi:hypothetical protein
MTAPNYWLGVVSQSHVARGVAGGFAQLCHGKSAPLRRMSPGDWLIYYSPKTDMDGGEPLQMFTAIGRVAGGKIYEHRMTADFVPFRRDVAYVPSTPAPIQPLIGELSFIKDPKRWGYPLRAGHIALTQRDFSLIAKAMGAAIHG